MEILKQLLLSVILSLSVSLIQAQSPVRMFSDIHDFLESLTGEIGEDEEISAFMEELEEKAEHPVNINNATTEELAEVPFITEEAINSIITFREKYGPFFSVFELTSLPGIDRELAEKISFFITTGTPSNTSQAPASSWKKGYHDLLGRVQQTFPIARGYKERDEKPPAYSGGPEKIFVRYRFEKRGWLQAGVTLEKDPGEPFFSKKTGFDHNSAFISFRVNDLIPRIIIGDFTAGTGQGAVIWQGFTMAESADILQTSKNLTYIKPHTSSEENRFFRGIATSLNFRHHRLHLFLSSHKRDGTPRLNSDSLWYVGSLSTSGYHRTPSEIAGKNRVRETSGALFWQYVYPGIKIGASTLFTTWNYPLIPGNQLYEKYYFRGKRLFNAGVDYRWIKGRIQLYGEAAVSHPGGKAFIQGVEARLHDQISIACSFRHFDRDYHAMWAGARASSSRCMNETGIHAAISLLPAPGISIMASTDWHRSPWILYTTTAPSSGNLSVIRGSFRISPLISGYIRYRSKITEIKIKEDLLYRQEIKNQHNLRLQADFNIWSNLSFRWRIEGTSLNQPVPEKGMIICHDINWKPLKVPVTASLRSAWFKTDSYASAIYVFEKDLLYAFSSLTCFGHGIRNYLNCKIKITDRLDGWIKFGHTFWFDRETTGSGNEEREGESKRELKMQVRYRF